MYTGIYSYSIAFTEFACKQLGIDKTKCTFYNAPWQLYVFNVSKSPATNIEIELKPTEADDASKIFLNNYISENPTHFGKLPLIT